MKNLLPLKAFVDTNIRGEWVGTNDFIVYQTATSRFKITVEHLCNDDPETPYMPFINVGRQEELSELGISSCCSDAKEMAEDLVNGWMEHFSPHEMQHLMTAIQDSLKKWHEERVAAFADATAWPMTIEPKPLHDRPCNDLKD